MSKAVLPHKNYILLDYDGFVCKSFYAALAKGDLYSAEEILDFLTESAIEKSFKWFDSNDVGVLPIMSGHSWKKDLYSDYKATRKRNEYLGIYRDDIINSNRGVIKPNTLEADELLIMIAETLAVNGTRSIIFSDDKDLKFYTTDAFCKINTEEDIEVSHDWTNIYEQMLAGDSEDNIKGIDKVGFKTAEKLLKNKPYILKSVIEIYKDKKVDRDECIKQLNLCIPMSLSFNKESSFAMDYVEIMLMNNYLIPDCLDIIQEGQLKYITEAVDKIYKEN